MGSFTRREFVRVVGRGAMGAGLLGPAGLVPGLDVRLPSPAAGGPGRPLGERPNIVLILADDMGFSDIGCYGGEVRTPNLDRLATEGLRFSQFYNAGRCCPSRASLLTGQYPHQAGLGHMTHGRFRPRTAYQGHLTEDCVTIAEALKGAGYRTYMTGKWHVGTDHPHWPTDRGFDRFYGEHNFVDGYFHPTNQLFLDGKPVEPDGTDWYSTDAYTDHALRFLEEDRGDERPFFLYLAHNAPHFPLQAFEEDRERYRGRFLEGWDELRIQRHARLRELGIADEGWPLSPRDDRAPSWMQAEDKELWDLKMAAYAAQIDRMDQNIGRVLRWLERSGQADDTIVLFLSDNGGCAETWIDQRNPAGALPGDRDCMLAYGLPWANLSDTPFRLFKRWVHEGGVATPLIVHWPGRIAPGGRTDQVGHVMDIMPTLLEAAGAAYPGERDGRPTRPMEGRSLLPALTGGNIEAHEILAWEHEGNRALRKGDWKLVARDRFVHGRWELYHLREDRTELTDLSARYPDKVRELALEYDAWADRVGVYPWDLLNA